MEILLQDTVVQILIIIIQVVVTILGGLLMNYLRTKIGSEKMSQYAEIAKTIVKATEQTLGSGNGADKKAESMQLVKQLTKNKLSEEQIDRLIEAAVYDMNTLLKINKIK